MKSSGMREVILIFLVGILGYSLLNIGNLFGWISGLILVVLFFYGVVSYYKTGRFLGSL